MLLSVRRVGIFRSLGGRMQSCDHLRWTKEYINENKYATRLECYQPDDEDILKTYTKDEHVLCKNESKDDFEVYAIEKWTYVHILCPCCTKQIIVGRHNTRNTNTNNRWQLKSKKYDVSWVSKTIIVIASIYIFCIIMQYKKRKVSNMINIRW